MTTLPSLTALAMDIHWERLVATNHVPVRYKRGRVGARLMAVPGAVLFRDNETSMEARVQAKASSFLIRPAELVLGGQTIEPDHGDSLELLDVADPTIIKELWTVVPGDQGAAWDWSDAHRTFYRIYMIRFRGDPNVSSN